ncbi:MAG: hypothetical protein NUV72_09430, partial [Bauldia sp.]|nr:hypothetical protein [Bauldia sp.]
RNWAHEMSGRLLSLAGNVGDEAREFCDGQQREFAGVAYALVVALRTRHHHISTDVCYTPLDRDSAHADVVFFQSNDDDKEMLRDWLQTVLKALRPDEIGALES